MRVLMVAYHFPPLAGSSGIQRTLRFVQHLPGFGWQPLVLTASLRAYERISTDLQAEIPQGTVVRRAFAVDAARHLSVGGRYLAALARPDRWMNWKYAAVWEGMRIIREFKPQAIWSTYPIATAHLIGAELHRRSGLPWLADFRDPMAQDGYPADPLTWNSFKAIEQSATQHAAYSIFSTPGAARIYRERFPEAARRIVVLENGYDEESFAAAERGGGAARAALNRGTVTLLHSGIVYPSERDPTQLFVALGRLAKAGKIRPGDFKIRFRAAVHDDLLHRLAAEHGVDAFIETCPPVAYRKALQEMLCADALLVMQGSNCNEQIPAKIYEYMRAGRPIVCLSDPAGDTVTALRRVGVSLTARLDSANEIEALLPTFLSAAGSQATGALDADLVRSASRRGRAESLARLLDAAVAGKAPS